MKTSSTQIEALADFLSAIDFTHFCTFTTRKPISVPSTRRAAEDVARFVKALAPSKFELKDVNPWEAKHSPFPAYAQLPIKSYSTQPEFEAISTMFWAAEKFDTRDGYHFHALLRTHTDSIDIFNWYFPRYGRCQIINNQDDDRRHAASYYCSKYITKQLTDYDFYFSDEIKKRKQLELNSLYNQFDKRI